MTQSKSTAAVTELESIVDADAYIIKKPSDYLPYIDDEFATARRILEASGSILSQVFPASYISPPENEHYETVEGEYYAVLNYCPHQSGPICEGEVSGHASTEDDGWTWKYEPVEKFIICPWHGWQFDVTTGKNTKDARYSVPRFGVKVVDDEIFVTSNRPE